MSFPSIDSISFRYTCFSIPFSPTSYNRGRGIFKNPPAPIQTVDKVPGLHRGFSIVVINILMILPVFIKKNPLLINSKVKRCALCTWYNYPIRRARL